MTKSREDLSILVELDVHSDEKSLKAFREIEAGIKIDPYTFGILCDNVENCFFHIDNSMFELLELKDKLLLQYLPRNVLLKITLVLSRFYRAYSQSQVSVYELIRLVQLYIEPFDMKCMLLKTLYDSNETKKRMLNIALQRLTSLENNVQQYEELKCINNWEKMYIRRALSRSNTRKWKFRMKTFREKVVLGYEHVMKWIHVAVEPSSAPEILSSEEQDDIRLETSDEIINEQKSSDYDNEIDSVVNHIEEQQQTEPQSVVTKTDREIQAQSNFDDQQTSTEDILSTKSLIIRLYRPTGIPKTKFECIVHAQGQKYVTDVFNLNKSNDENTKTKGRLIKKRNESSIVEKQQTVEFLIPMPSFLQRRSLFQTDIDPDAIKIDILGDGKLCGSLIFTSEDLRMLDLPNLHSSIINDDNIPPNNNQFDFDQTSTELYESWISHTPQTFSIYDDKHEPIGKLPLLMFWYNKIENTHATKSTITDPMEVREPTPKITSSLDENIADENRCVDVTDDHIEIVKTTYENEIVKIHEYYQTEIHRLTNLLISREMIDKDRSNTNTRQRMEQQTKRETITERQSAPVYGRNLPKNFVDRSQMYLQRSLIHRHQLVAKVEQETALELERRMKTQHRLHKPEQINEYDDLCLPAVFMPFRSGNVFNPRAYQFFHSVGSSDSRLTQSPSVLKFPSLPSRTLSVLNLFELSRAYETNNEKDRFIDKKTQGLD